MALDPELLKILACPVCKSPLDYHPEALELFCAKCGRRYEVEDGIPNLIAEEGGSSRGV